MLVFSFILHIIFIHLMIGGSILTLWSQWKGLKDPKYDTFTHEIAKTITVNKSLAVVLGVAPLLSINTDSNSFHDFTYYFKIHTFNYNNFS